MLKEASLNLFFPQWCLGCGREGAYICATCQRKLPRIMEDTCPVCGRQQPEGELCHTCLNSRPAIDSIHAPFRFEGLIRQAVHKFKYQNLRALDAPLACFMNEYLAKHPLEANAIMPVPLHPKRLRQRGYNQSHLLALKLGKLSGLPVNDNYLLRQRPTPPQTETTSVKQRRANVAGAFTCAKEKLDGQHILLIDDVATSGATLDTCAAALKLNGAASVRALTLAREL